MALDQKINPDEKRILELFVIGKASSIVGRADLNTSEGYSFEGVPELGWSADRTRRTLAGLQLKGMVSARLSDRLLLCKFCRSPNLRTRRLCPTCKSIDLTKHPVIEHLACGLIDKQDAFQIGADLVCPRCKAKLIMLGSDYRSLSYMYSCQECGGLTRDLETSLVCNLCGTEADVDEQNECQLFSYYLSERDRKAVFDQMKPIEACSQYFLARGFTVEAPGLVVGRSGAQHTFDMAIHRRPEGAPARRSGITEFSDIVVEIQLSDRPIDVEELAKFYGKLSDLDLGGLILAIPGLSKEASDYSKAFKLRVVGGATVEKAIQAMEPTAELIQGFGG